MIITILYFSGTGNSYYVAKRIGGKAISIAKLIKENKYTITDDIIGIIFPIYYLSVPNIVKDYLQESELNCQYLFGIATYGSATGSIAKQLNKLKPFDYVNMVQMTDNYLPFFEMKKEKELNKNVNAESKISKIIIDIGFKMKNITTSQSSQSFISTCILMARCYKDYKNIKKIDYKLSTNENCKLCGTCSKICPVDNISLENKVIFHHECEGCLACIHICPNNVMKMKTQKSDERYFHEKVDKESFISLIK